MLWNLRFLFSFYLVNFSFCLSGWFGKVTGTKLNETEVNNYLQPFLGQYEDSFQQAWVDIREYNPQTLEEITRIIRRVRNKAIK